jgi:hypothetical protein
MKNGGDCVSDGNAAHGSGALVMEMTEGIEKFFPKALKEDKTVTGS